jgi:chromosome partitioning protein
MTIYAVVNTKGGVGKTTTAVHLATMLARDAKTLLIDGDPQATAASWAAWRRDASHVISPTTTRLAGKAVITEGRGLAAGFAHTIVDAGGRDSGALRAALLLASVAIVPVGASNFDSAAMTDLLEIVDLARDHNPSLDVRVLLSRVDPRTKETGEMLEFLAEQNLNVLSVRVHERVAYRRATGEGLIVHEVGKNKDVQAIKEMDALLKEVTE